MHTMKNETTPPQPTPGSGYTRVFTDTVTKQLKSIDDTGTVRDYDVPSAHAASHEDSGSDEISVAGLSGVLADAQNANQIQGRDVDNAAPSEGNLLRWSVSDSKWKPAVKELPANYLYGLNSSRATVSTVTIDIGGCRSDDDLEDIIVSSPLTADITAAGENGLDTGSEAANTWYYIWVIKNPTTSAVASLLSASDTSPTLPPGYTRKRRVGSVRNNAASSFVDFRTGGNCGSKRVFYYGPTLVLNGGSALTFTDIDLSAAVPPVTESCTLLAIALDPTPAAFTYQVRSDGKTTTTYYGYGYNQGSDYFNIAAPGQIVEYFVGAAAVLLYVTVSSYGESL